MPKGRRAKAVDLHQNSSEFPFPLWDAPGYGYLPLVSRRNKADERRIYASNQLSWNDTSAQPSVVDELNQMIEDCSATIHNYYDTAKTAIETVLCDDIKDNAPCVPLLPKTPKTNKKTRKRMPRKSRSSVLPVRRSTRTTKQRSVLATFRKSGQFDSTLFSLEDLQEKLKGNTETMTRVFSPKIVVDPPSAEEEEEVTISNTEPERLPLEVSSLPCTKTPNENTESINHDEGTRMEVSEPLLTDTPKQSKKSFRLSTPMKGLFQKKLSVTVVSLTPDQVNESVGSSASDNAIKTDLSIREELPIGKQDKSGLCLALTDSEDEFTDMVTDEKESKLAMTRRSTKHKLVTSTKVLGGLAAKRRSTRQSLHLKVIATQQNARQHLDEETPSFHGPVIMEEQQNSSQTEVELVEEGKSLHKPRIAKPVLKSKKKPKPKITSFLTSKSATTSRTRKTPTCTTPVSSHSRFLSPLMRTPKSSNINATVQSFLLRNTPERYNKEAELLEKKRKVEEKQRKEEERQRQLEEEKKQKLAETKMKREARALRAVRQRELREKAIREKQGHQQEQWEQRIADADRLRAQRKNEEVAKMSKQMEKLAKAEAKRREEEEEKQRRLKEQEEERLRRFEQQAAEKKLAEEQKQREKRLDEERKKVEEERQKVEKLEEARRRAMEEEENEKQMKLEAERAKKKQEEAKQKKQERLRRIKEEREKLQIERELAKKQKLEEKRVAREDKLLREQKKKDEERRLREEKQRQEQEKEEEAARLLKDALRKAEETKRAIEEEAKRKNNEATRQLRIRIEETRKLQEEKLKEARYQDQIREKEKEYLRKIQENEERNKALEAQKEGASASQANTTYAQDKSMLNSTYSKANESVDNYNMTPRGPGRPLLPSTSTNYNLDDFQSDDSTDNEDEPKKPIPMWAKGALLNSAILHQHRFPPNVNEIFPGLLNAVYLDTLFKARKERYFKRTSSAQWNSPIMPVGHISFTKQTKGF